MPDPPVRSMLRRSLTALSGVLLLGTVGAVAALPAPAPHVRHTVTLTLASTVDNVGTPVAAAAPAAPAAQSGAGTAQSLSGRFFAPWGGGAGIAWNDQNTSITGAIGIGRGGSFSWAGDQPATSSSVGADLRLGQSFTLFNQKIFSWGVQGTGDTTDTFKLKGSVAASIPGTKFGFQGSLTLSYDPQNGWQLKFAPLTDRFSLGSEASASITGTLALPGWTPKRLFSQMPGLTGTAQAAQPPTTTPDPTTPDTTTPDTTAPDTTTPVVPDTSAPDTTTPAVPDTPDTQVPSTTPDTGTTTPATPVLPAVPDVSSAEPAIPDVTQVSAPVTPIITDPTPALPAITDPTPALPAYTATVPDIPPPADISSDLGNGLGSTGSDLGNGLDSGTGSGVTSDLGNGLGTSDTSSLGSLDSGGSFSGGDSGE